MGVDGQGSIEPGGSNDDKIFFGAALPLEVTGCGCVSCSIQGSRATLGRSINFLSYYYYLIYLSPQDSPSSAF